MAITNATISSALQSSELPVAVYNDSGIYKLWTPALLPGTEPDGLLTDIADDLTGTISETVDSAEVDGWSVTITATYTPTGSGEQTGTVATTSDASAEASATVTGEGYDGVVPGVDYTDLLAGHVLDQHKEQV